MKFQRYRGRYIMKHLPSVPDPRWLALLSRARLGQFSGSARPSRRAACLVHEKHRNTISPTLSYHRNGQHIALTYPASFN